MSLYINILTKALCVAALSQTSVENNTVGTDATGPTITVQQIRSSRIAFVKHRGAYWSIGPVIARVRNTLGSKQPAPKVFVRYESDPRRISPLQLEARVGFVLEIGQVAPDGFQTDTRPPQQVASMMTNDSPSVLARHYTMLETWAKSHGYQPLGPVIERYPPNQEDSKGVEIQLVVQPAPKAPNAQSSASPAQTLKKPVRENNSQEVPAPSVAEPTIRTTPANDHAGSTRKGLGESPRAPLSATTPASQVPAAGDPSTDYTELAIRLIPPTEDWTAGQLATLGPKVMRIRAIAHLAKTRYGSDAADLSNLSDALTKRYTHVWGTRLASAVTPPAKSSKTDPAANGPLEQLNRIFSKMLTDQLDAHGVEMAVLAVLTDTPDSGATQINPAAAQPARLQP